MGIQVKSYMTVRPPEIPGMEIASATVQIETPAAADSGELADRRLVELREQREALIAARRQEHILENRVKAAETAADDPRSALDYALADGRMTEQECLERLQQTDPFGERAGRSELEEAINLLQQMLAERGHLDPYREDIEELVGRVRGLAAAQPGVSGIQGAPTQGGVEVQRADLNVSADMPSHVHVGRVVSAACRLSRAEIETAAGKARDEGRVSADAARLITLEVLPKVNAEVVGEDRAAVPVPGEGRTSEAYFDVRATHAGTCQVWVVVRQGPLPLLMLRLEAAATDAQPAGPVTRRAACGDGPAAWAGRAATRRCGWPW